MANNIKKDQILAKAVRFGILLCVVAVVAALLINGFSDNQYNMEKVFTVKVKSAEDIERLGKSVYNNNLVLQNDIRISDSSFRIGSEAYPFQGTFDGNGYSIIFDFTAAEGEYSLFGELHKDARVLNTTFDYKAVKATGASFSGIAQNNEGTIENCKVKLDSLVIDSTGGFSPFVNVNNGIINKCVAFGTVKNEKLTREQEKSVKFGSFCVYNYGSISNVVAITRFESFLCTDEQKVFANETDNKGIGAIVSEDFSGALQNVLAVVTPGTYVSDGDLRSIEFFDSAKEALTYDRIMNDLDFTNIVWEFGNGDMYIKNANGMYSKSKK